MTPVAPNHDSDGRNICIQCGDTLIVPERSEDVNERLVLNHWFCSKCGCRFESESSKSVDDNSTIDPATMEAFFPSLLVA